MNQNPLQLELLLDVERSLVLAEAERRRRMGWFDRAGPHGGMRAWAAARLLTLALRLDPASVERTAPDSPLGAGC